jgi:glucose dehydrogenase
VSRRLGLVVVLLVGVAACGDDEAATRPSVAGAATRSWAFPNHDLSNTRNAQHSLITSETIGRLGVAWTAQPAGSGNWGAWAGSTALAVDGVVYQMDMAGNVSAMRLDSGAELWTHAGQSEVFGPNGVGVEGGIAVGVDGQRRLVALSTEDGRELWTFEVDENGQELNIQPVIADGVVYLSTTPSLGSQGFYPGGAMGILHALDATTGDVLWSFNTVKDGDLWGNPDVNSGGGAWYPPAVDSETGITYWGTGNPAPFGGTREFPNGSSRPGPNLYTNSILAIDRDGRLVWYQQVKAHDLTDGDFQLSPILTRVDLGGVERKVVIGGGKLGYVLGFDAATGEQLWKVSVGEHLNDDLDRLPEALTDVMPGILGGVETPMALGDGVVVAAANNMPSSFSATDWAWDFDTETATADVVAVEAAKGTVRWSVRLDGPVFSGVTITGDLVLTATYQGRVVALDLESGQQVWEWQSPTRINAGLTVVGDTLLIPAGDGRPVFVAMRLGATGTVETPAPPTVP